MRSPFAIALGLTVALAGVARSDEQNAAPELPPGVIPPKATGEPHMCPVREWLGQVYRRHEGGAIVGLSYSIEPDGSLKDVKVAQSSSYADLDDYATRCVSRWRYMPATQGGVPVEVPWGAKLRFSVCVSPSREECMSRVSKAAPPQPDQQVGSTPDNPAMNPPQPH